MDTYYSVLAIHVHDYDLPIENVCEFCIRLTHNNSYSYLEVSY